LFFQVKGRKYLEGVEEEVADKDMGLQMGNFDVLLTVHLSIILAINQLNAQILLL